VGGGQGRPVGEETIYHADTYRYHSCNTILYGSLDGWKPWMLYETERRADNSGAVWSDSSSGSMTRGVLGACWPGSDGTPWPKTHGGHALACQPQMAADQRRPLHSSFPIKKKTKFQELSVPAGMRAMQRRCRFWCRLFTVLLFTHACSETTGNQWQQSGK
jgi:hypothetical protein